MRKSLKVWKKRELLLCSVKLYVISGHFIFNLTAINFHLQNKFKAVYQSAAVLQRFIYYKNKLGTEGNPGPMLVI